MPLVSRSATIKDRDYTESEDTLKTELKSQILQYWRQSIIKQESTQHFAPESFYEAYKH